MFCVKTSNGCSKCPVPCQLQCVSFSEQPQEEWSQGHTGFLCGKQSYLMTRMTICFETSGSKEKIQIAKGSYILLEQKTFKIVDFMDYNHLSKYSGTTVRVLQTWPRRPAQLASETLATSSFLRHRLLFIQCMPSLLEFKFLVPKIIWMMPSINIRHRITFYRLSIIQELR